MSLPTIAQLAHFINVITHALIPVMLTKGHHRGLFVLVQQQQRRWQKQHINSTGIVTIIRWVCWYESIAYQYKDLRYLTGMSCNTYYALDLQSWDQAFLDDSDGQTDVMLCGALQAIFCGHIAFSPEIEASILQKPWTGLNARIIQMLVADTATITWLRHLNGSRYLPS